MIPIESFIITNRFSWPKANKLVFSSSAAAVLGALQFAVVDTGSIKISKQIQDLLHVKNTKEAPTHLTSTLKTSTAILISSAFSGLSHSIKMKAAGACPFQAFPAGMKASCFSAALFWGTYNTYQNYSNQPEKAAQTASLACTAIAPFLILRKLNGQSIGEKSLETTNLKSLKESLINQHNKFKSVRVASLLAMYPLGFFVAFSSEYFSENLTAGALNFREKHLPASPLSKNLSSSSKPAE